MSNDTCRDLGSVDSSRSTETHLIILIFQLKDQPFAQCSMDMIMDLPLSNGYDSILAVVDHGLMKGVILIPCNKTLTADQCAKLLLDNVLYIIFVKFFFTDYPDFLIPLLTFDFTSYSLFFPHPHVTFSAFILISSFKYFSIVPNFSMCSQLPFHML